MTNGIDNGLWKAANYLNDKGFVKSSLGHANGPVCALGAYFRANDIYQGTDTSNGIYFANQNEKYAKELVVLADVIRELYPDRANDTFTFNQSGRVVYHFNDHAHTTKEDVAKVLRVAAVKVLSA